MDEVGVFFLKILFTLFRNFLRLNLRTSVQSEILEGSRCRTRLVFDCLDSFLVVDQHEDRNFTILTGNISEASFKL